MSELATFCRQVRNRSDENTRAFHLLYDSRLYGNAMSVLRQELDSMVRVIYLLSIADPVRRAELIVSSTTGRGWRGSSGGRITDREMVELADALHSWTRSVYRFGCAFIHLSDLHDYRHRDPWQALTNEERTDLIQHLRYNHGGPRSSAARVEDIIPYLPSVFNKVASNLQCYLDDLEHRGKLET